MNEYSNFRHLEDSAQCVGGSRTFEGRGRRPLACRSHPDPLDTKSHPAGADHGPAVVDSCGARRGEDEEIEEGGGEEGGEGEETRKQTLCQ